jgi:hypothetical protein
MKHDRTVLNARGGPWATIADAVRAETKAILETGRPLYTAPVSVECDELARRRSALGLTMKQFGRAAKMSKSTVYTVEIGTSGAEALQRYRAALERLEKYAPGS